ncbi:sigma-70 family RNA polymerase sigma factor [Agathobacter sp.]
MKNDKKEQLVTENINLIYLVMKRFRNRGVENDDLFQIGAVGLTKAAERFDESMGYTFSTYAVPMIIGEIQRFLRDDGMVHISRKIQEDARKIAIVREKLKKSENKEITVEKLENILGLSKQDIIIAMDAGKTVSSIENETVLDFLENKVSVSASEKSSESENVINHIAMRQAVEKLEENERRLIYLRYVREKTQKQVADELGRNQVAVSRMEKNVLAKLRKDML